LPAIATADHAGKLVCIYKLFLKILFLEKYLFFLTISLLLSASTKITQSMSRKGNFGIMKQRKVYLKQKKCRKKNKSI